MAWIIMEWATIILIDNEKYVILMTEEDNGEEEISVIEKHEGKTWGREGSNMWKWNKWEKWRKWYDRMIMTIRRMKDREKTDNGEDMYEWNMKMKIIDMKKR